MAIVLIFSFVCPLILIILNQIYFKKRFSLNQLAWILNTAVIITILGTAHLSIIYYNHQLKQYDLNGDGEYSQVETTPTVKAIQACISSIEDKMRSPAVIILTLFASNLYIVVIHIFRWLKENGLPYRVSGVFKHPKNIFDLAEQENHDALSALKKISLERNLNYFNSLSCETQSKIKEYIRTYDENGELLFSSEGEECDYSLQAIKIKSLFKEAGVQYYEKFKIGLIEITPLDDNKVNIFIHNLGDSDVDLKGAKIFMQEKGSFEQAFTFDEEAKKLPNLIIKKGISQVKIVFTKVRGNLMEFNLYERFTTQRRVYSADGPCAAKLDCANALIEYVEKIQLD